MFCDRQCPVCGTPIPSGMSAGELCLGCAHTFTKADVTQTQDEDDRPFAEATS